MTERVHTGGRKTFVYLGNERFGDTKYTREFKKGYRKYVKNKHRRHKKHRRRIYYYERPTRRISKKIITPIVLLLIVFAFYLLYKGIVSYEMFLGGAEEINLNCTDGTFYSKCSEDKPYYCLNGSLVKRASICGCPSDYRAKGDFCKKIIRCSDETESGYCSTDKPFFCLNGNLVERPETCGCPNNFYYYEGSCMERSKADAIEALDYLNEIRKENGRSELAWNDNLYELAMFRSKDMYDRKYFDHVTPEGKCIKDFKAGYGLTDYNIAENVGASAYNLDENNMQYASYENPVNQIDNWMNSRGHRYNLLYSSHVMGVAACYRGACVFLGANTEYYGLGYGPCTTGEEGLAFWETTEKQEGEI